MTEAQLLAAVLRTFYTDAHDNLRYMYLEHVPLCQNLSEEEYTALRKWMHDNNVYSGSVE